MILWCENHHSNGRGPSPDGERCHYAALRLATRMAPAALGLCAWEPGVVVTRTVFSPEAIEAAARVLLGYAPDDENAEKENEWPGTLTDVGRALSAAAAIDFGWETNA